MPIRRYPTDRPDREPRSRAGVIEQVIDSTKYVVNFDGLGQSQVASYSGGNTLTVGTRVRCSYEPETYHWKIDAQGIVIDEDEYIVSQFEDDGYWDDATNGGTAFNNTSTRLSWSSFNELHAFALFRGVVLEQGETVSRARLDLTIDWVSSAPVLGRISGNDIDTAIAPTDVATADALALTTASVLWSFPTNIANGSAIRSSSPDISLIIEEIVARPGWVSGNDILLLVHYEPPESGFVEAYQYPDGISPVVGTLPALVITRGAGPTAPVDAPDVLYAPTTPADWAATPPATVQEALDRLAAVAGSPP